MGYRIEYGADSQRKEHGQGLWGLLFFSVVLAAVYRFVPTGRRMLLEFLWPGGSEPAARAMGKLLTMLRQGQPVMDAMASFCLEILEGGGIA